MRTIERSLVWLLIGSVFLLACDSENGQRKAAKEQKAREERRAEDKVKRDEIISALKKSHAADDTWDKDIRLITWTLDLQERIIGKPIVSSGLLVDVWLGWNSLVRASAKDRCYAKYS
jgi:hypothetical protein